MSQVYSYHCLGGVVVEGAMSYDGNNRYQFQPRWIKCLRWIRHRPWSLMRFAYCMAWWACHGFPDNHWGNDVHPGRLDAINHYWTICKSVAQYKMGHWFTLDECKAELNGKQM